jgi:NADH-quinone oxidoreductase subunit E
MNSPASPPVNPFDEPLKGAVEGLVARYPERRAALLPVLTLVQKERGHLSDETIGEVSQVLGLTPAYVHGVISFYGMYDREPVGKHKMYVCKTLSCRLRGADEVIDAIASKIGVDGAGTSADGKFTLVPFECLGLCDIAPCMLVGGERHGNLTADNVGTVLDGMEAQS